jgi:hypothetical protein
VSFAAFPGAFAGAFGSSLTNRFWGLEANLTGQFKSNRLVRCGWLAGVRYLRFDEQLEMVQVPTLLGNGTGGFFGEVLAPGDALAIQDAFVTRSQFWGPQVGALAELKLGPAVVAGSFKLAMGNSHEVVGVHGTTTLVRPGEAPRRGVGGLLAVESNIGRDSSDVFAVVPEVGVSLGIQPIRYVRATLGYNFLYWSSVLRASDQVNRTVNPTQVPASLLYAPLTGPAQPRVPFDQTDFWAQGLNFSLELRF